MPILPALSEAEVPLVRQQTALSRLYRQGNRKGYSKALYLAIALVEDRVDREKKRFAEYLARQDTR
jgi:hypothetical protein